MLCDGLIRNSISDDPAGGRYIGSRCLPGHIFSQFVGFRALFTRKIVRLLGTLYPRGPCKLKDFFFAGSKLKDFVDGMSGVWESLQHCS